MKKALCLTGIVLLLAGHLFSRLGGPTTGVARVDAQDAVISESALRHKLAQPNHWRALVLRQ